MVHQTLRNNGFHTKKNHQRRQNDLPCSCQNQGLPYKIGTFDRRSDARRWSQKKEEELRSTNLTCSIKNKQHTLGELVDRYVSQVMPDKKDIAIQTHQLNWWKTPLGDCSLSAVSSAMISECRDELKKGQTQYGTPRSAATVNRYLAVLSHAFTIAWKEWDWINFNPVLNTRKLKEPRGRVRFLDEKERERLLKACRES